MESSWLVWWTEAMPKRKKSISLHIHSLLVIRLITFTMNLDYITKKAEIYSVWLWNPRVRLSILLKMIVPVNECGVYSRSLHGERRFLSLSLSLSLSLQSTCRVPRSSCFFFEVATATRCTYREHNAFDLDMKQTEPFFWCVLWFCECKANSGMHDNWQ